MFALKILRELIEFRFIWLGSQSLKERGVDRIKRSILKNEIVKGGLNVTDIECLNMALKLRQYMRPPVPVWG